MDAINTVPISVISTPEVQDAAGIVTGLQVTNPTPTSVAAGPLILDAGYKGDATTSHAAKIIGVQDIHGWEVTDAEEDTAMVHYDDEADMRTQGHLRGIFLDLEVDAIIADSFGYTPTAVASELILKEGKLRIQDIDGVTHVFDPEEVNIKRVFEGVVIRAIWRKSRLYRITHRTINPVKSRWGGSKSFLTLYDEAGGPTAEQLFDTTKPFSSTCYDFLVVDQALLVGTRQQVNKPYIVLLSAREMDIKRPAEQVAQGRFGTVETTVPITNNIGGSVNASMIHMPSKLSLEEANHHLKFGYYNEFTVDDPRQLTGEAVIVYRMENGAVADVVKVHSPAYDWRVNMRGNNPNAAHQFYCLLNMAYGDVNETEAWETFKKRFILLPAYDEKSLKELYAISKALLTIPTGDVSSDDYANRDDRIHLLWMNYVLSLPVHLQEVALDFLSQFRKDRNDLIDWLQTFESTTQNIEAAEIPERAKGLISSSRRLARERISKGENYSQKGSYMKLPVLIKSTIRNLVNKENGPSLFGLTRDMKLMKAGLPFKKRDDV